MLLLVGLYGAYEYVTDPKRLRALAERELQGLLGAEVKVGHARASLSGVLLLKDVHISLGEGPGDEVLSAERIDADLRMSRLLRGDVAFERITVAQAKLTLCENEDSGKWNIAPILARLGRDADHQRQEREREQKQGEAGEPLPHLLISQLEVVFTQIRHGAYSHRGAIRLDASLQHLAGSRYSFDFLSSSGGRLRDQDRTAITGSVDLASGEVLARLHRMSFNEALVRILPKNVRRVLEDFAFAGDFRIPTLRYRPTPGAPPAFAVRVEFDHLGLAVHPRHLLSRQERRRMEMVEAALRLFRGMDLNRPVIGMRPDDPATRPAAGFVPVRLVDYLDRQLQSRPMVLRDFAGAITFSNSGIEVEQLAGRLEGNDLVFSGELPGYDPAGGYQLDGPARLRVATAEGKRLKIPPTPQFMTWMPDGVRRVYQQFEPTGEVGLQVDLVRAAAGADMGVSVRADLFDSRFTYDDFPYTLYGCTGRLLFGREPATGEEKVTIERLRGHGARGGVNENNYVEVNGKVGPFMEGGVGVDLYVTGKNVQSEPALRRAFPKGVRKAFRIFGPLDYAQRTVENGDRRPVLSPEDELEWPRFVGDFVAHAYRLPGPLYDSVITLDLDIHKATGTLRTFAYPLENLSVKLHVKDDALTIENARMTRGNSVLRLDGTVQFGDPADPRIQVKATRVPIDDTLLSALPPAERSWIRRAGLAGEIDIEGSIFTKPTPDGLDTETDFDLGLTLREASILPRGGKPAVTALAGNVRLRPNQLSTKKLSGRRGDATLEIGGQVSWGDEGVGIDVQLAAANLLFEPSLYELLPRDAKEAWDSQQPQGIADVRLHYIGSPVAEPATQPATTQAVATRDEAPTTRPRGAPATRPADHIELQIDPRQLLVRPQMFPYTMTLSQGRAIYRDGELTLEKLGGIHGPAKLTISGSGRVDKHRDITLSVAATDLVLEEEFIAAVPGAVASVINGVSAKGNVNLRLSKLHLRESNLQRLSQADRSRVAAAQARAAATRPAGEAPDLPLDADFDGAVEFLGSSMDVGLLATDCRGTLAFRGEVVADRLKEFSGEAKLDSFHLAGIAGSDLTAKLEKPELKDQIRVRDLRTTIAGGVLGGAATFEWYERAASRYAVDLLVRNASLKEVVSEKTLGEGRLTASLTSEGELSTGGFRRGRGDVSITGEKMYDLPLLVGLSQIVTLGLPISEPLNDMKVSYYLDNSKVTLENLELRSPTNLIQGRGSLDFKTRKIDMVLTTDSPQKLPIPGLDVLRKELFEIRIRGTLQEPEVKAQTLPTFRTTIDEVLGQKK